MSFGGNVWDFEKFKLGNMWDKVRKNPEQLLLGAGDPFSAKLWSGVTGKDYSPLVDQMGGATSDDYRKAEAAGIDTGNGRTMHDLARAIAGTFAGKYGAEQASGALNFSGGQSPAPIVDMSSQASPETVGALQGAGSSASPQYAKLLQSFMSGAGGRGGGSSAGGSSRTGMVDPLASQTADPAVASAAEAANRRALADALLARGGNYQRIGG